MEHWIEPQALAPPAAQAPAQAPAPTQQQMLGARQAPMQPGIVTRVLRTAQAQLPGILFGAALVAVVLPWFGVAVSMKPRKRG